MHRDLPGVYHRLKWDEMVTYWSRTKVDQMQHHDAFRCCSNDLGTARQIGKAEEGLHLLLLFHVGNPQHDKAIFVRATFILSPI